MSDLSERIANLSARKRALLALRLRQQGEVPSFVSAEPIAIIGLSCRFPGAESADAYWRLLRDEKDAITEVPAERWDIETYYDPNPAVPGKMNTRWGGFLEDVDQFDPTFFGISPREAVSIDPQQRLLLEVSWEALEHAGQPPDLLVDKETGVFVGVCSNDYSQLQPAIENPSRIDPYFGTGNALSFTAGRISYLLGLQGPSIIVDTACSSSLVAVHLACQSLRLHESSLALAAGVNLMLSPVGTIYFSQLRAMAADGRCKSFDANADGFVRSEGCGIVVLKRLSDAMANGDRVLAVIRGSAVNHDGRSAGLTIPSRNAQETLIRKALANAGVEAASVDYVEAHGTGTALGDPIEVNALAGALGEGRSRQRPVVIGSVKTNIGHTEAAAGVAGLIKVVLSLQHEEIPPQLHVRELNPYVSWKELPVRVATTRTPWPAQGKSRVAGISSFGFNGTNAHVVVEEAPRSTPPECVENSAPGQSHLLPLSARSSEALRALAAELARYLAERPCLSLRDLCYTASLRRSHHPFRLALLARSSSDLPSQLNDHKPLLHDDDRHHPRAAHRPPSLVYVFSGQGPQWAGVGRQLLASEPSFRNAFMCCDEALRPLLGWSVLDALQQQRVAARAAVSQPVIFAVQVGLAALWQAWGIESEAVIGHGLGEVAAAHVAGVLEVEEAARVVSLRAELVERKGGDGGGGRRLAVGLSLEEYEKEMAQALHDLSPRRAKLPIFSTVTGEMSDGSDLDGTYWARNSTQPVQFARAICELAKAGHGLFLEISPHPILAGDIARCMSECGRKATVLSSLKRGREERASMLRSLSELYMLKFSVNWDQLYPDGGQLLDLPSYPWQRERYWIETSERERQPLAVSENEVVKTPALKSVVESIVERWGGDGAHAINRKYLAPSIFLGSSGRCLFYVNRTRASITGFIYVGPEGEYETLVKELLAYSDKLKVQLNLLAKEAETPVLRGLGFNTTPCGVLQTIEDLKSFTLKGNRMRRLRYLVGHYEKFGDCATTEYRPGTDRHTAQEINGVIDAWVEQKSKPAPFVPVLKEEIAAGTLDPKYRLFVTRRNKVIESVVVLSPATARGGYLMDLEFYKPHLPLGCLEFTLVGIIDKLRDEGCSFFSLGGTFGAGFNGHPNDEREAGELFAALHARNILNGDANFQFKNKFRPQTSTLYLCRLPQSDPSNLSDVLTVLAGFPAEGQNGNRPGLENKSLEGLTGLASHDRPRPRPSQLSGKDGSNDGIHPLLGSRLHLAGRDIVFESRLGATSLTFLREHRIFGHQLLPGTSYLEMAWAATTESCGENGTHILKDIVIHQPMTIPQDGRQIMQLRLQPETSAEFSFHIFSIAENDSDQQSLWKLHATGKISADDKRSRAPSLGRVSLENLMTRCTEEVSGEAYYRQLAELGLNYGASFQGVEHLWRRDGEAVGRIRLPETLEPEAEQYHYHPALLDACFQLLAAAMPACGRRPDRNDTYLLRGVESFRIHAPARLRVWCQALLRSSEDGDEKMINGDIFLFDESGDCIAEVEGLHAKRMSRDALACVVQDDHTLDWLYDVQWQLKPYPRHDDPADRFPSTTDLVSKDTPPNPGGWLILSEGGGVGRALAGRLRAASTTVLLAYRADDFALLDDGSCRLDPCNPSHYDLLLEHAARTGGAAWRGIIHLWGLDQIEGHTGGVAVPDWEALEDALRVGCGSVLSLVQAVSRWARARPPAAVPRLWVVTRGAQAVGAPGEATVSAWQSAVYGVGRVLAVEQPELYGGMVDLEEGVGAEEQAGQVVRELLGAGGEKEVAAWRGEEAAYRGGRRYVARLMRTRHVEGERAGAVSGQETEGGRVRLRSDGTYLVTGGLGGLGRRVARWMLERGAGRVVLVGRRELSAQQQSAVVREVLSGAGVEVDDSRVVIRRVDVSERAEVRSLVAEINERMPQLRGVVHAAGVVEDGVVARLGWEQFARVLRPKAAGGWNLHAETAGEQLDFFVLFSSAASLIGLPGQANHAAANAFLDGLAHHRRGLGLPSTSINWGIWSEVGAAAERNVGERAAQLGVGTIAPEQGLKILEKVLRESRTQVLVMPVNWQQWNESHSSSDAPPLLANFAGGDTETDASSNRTQDSDAPLRETILAAGSERRQQLLMSHLCGQVAELLALPESKLAVNVPLNSLGFDSLMTIELKDRLELSLGVKMPFINFLQDPSIEQVASQLLEQLPTSVHTASSLAQWEDAGSLSAQLARLSDAEVTALLNEKLLKGGGQ